MDVETEAGRLLTGMGDAPGARGLVARHLGADAVRVVATLPAGDACAVRTASGWEIRVLHGLTERRLRWALLHELAEVHLSRLGVGGNVEGIAEQLTAALAMPRRAFVADVWRCRMDLAVLADWFVVSQTAASLRLAEACILRGAAVVHPHFRMERGRACFDGAEQRALTDAPMRVAHLVA